MGLMICQALFSGFGYTSPRELGRNASDVLNVRDKIGRKTPPSIKVVWVLAHQIKMLVVSRIQVCFSLSQTLTKQQQIEINVCNLCLSLPKSSGNSREKQDREIFKIMR